MNPGKVKMSNSSKRMKLSNERDLDCTNATRRVWLVKVPKYMSSRWQNAAPLSVAGRLKITSSRNVAQKPDIKFTLSDEMLTPNANDKADVPKEHHFSISNVMNQTVTVFSQSGGSENGDASSGQNDSNSGKLVLEGVVVQKGECRPLADHKYMMLKRTCILEASQPDRQVKQLKNIVPTFKPISDHKHNIEFEQKKKAEGKKARDDKDKVMDVLFAAFEKHQYYNIKDLEKITKQPITYLKEILKEICNYNAKNPHKSMWELKPEYRCYKDQEAGS